MLDKSRHENNIAMTTFLSNNPIVIERTKRRGISMLLSPAVRLVRINDIDLHTKNNPMKNPWLIKLGTKLLKTLKTNKVRELSNNIEIRPASSFGEEIGRYYERIKPLYNFISVKNPEYLNWRFCDKRGGDYLTLKAWKGEELVGYIISRIATQNPEYPVGYVYEIQYLPGRTDIGYSLLRETTDYLDSKKVNLIIAWALKKQSIIKIFEKAGFLDSRRNQNIRFKPIKRGHDFNQFLSSDIDKIEYHLGYTDSN
jgi:hypothetical protein